MAPLPRPRVVKSWNSGLDDVDNLQLQEYDALCGEKRTYYSVRQMARKRVSRQKKNDNDEKER